MVSTLTPAEVVRNALLFGDAPFCTDADIAAVQFAPDGHLWTIEESGILSCWDVASGMRLRSHELSDLETLWRFNADAKMAASGGDSLSLWNVPDGELITANHVASWITAIAFDSQGKHLATGHDDGTVSLWDLRNLQLLWHCTEIGVSVSALAFSPEGKRLAVGDEGKKITLVDVGSGQVFGTLRGHAGHKDRISDLAWHPDGKTLVSAGWDTTARVWDVDRQDIVILLNAHDVQVFRIAFSPDGGLLACADSGPTIRVWDFDTKSTRHVLQLGRTTFTDIAFSHDGQTLASVAGRVIHLWQPQTGKLLTPGGEQEAIPAMTLTPGGDRLIANTVKGVAVYDASDPRRQERSLAVEDTVCALACPAAGEFVAIGCLGCVEWRSWMDGARRHRWSDLKVPATALSVSPDGSLVASAGREDVAVWIHRTDDGEPLLLIPDALDGCTVEALAFHPDGRRIAVAGLDREGDARNHGAVCIWDIVDRCETATFTGPFTCLAWDQEGKRLLAGDLDGSICIWDVDAAALSAEVPCHIDEPRALAFHPAEDGFACGGAQGDLFVYAGGQPKLLHLDHPIFGLQYSPDGRYLFVANGNATYYRLELQA